MNTNVTIPNNVDIPTTSSLLADYAGEVLGAVPGARLKFAKGEWTCDDAPVAKGEQFIVHPETITRCLEKWEGKRIVDRVVARLGDRLPPRSTLGDTDESLWELGLDGRPRDPWGEVHYLGLTRIEDGSAVAFAATSDGGKKAIGRLAMTIANLPSHDLRDVSACDAEPGNSWKWEAVAALFDSWSAYAVRAAEKPGTKKAFSQAMQGRGFVVCQVGDARTRSLKGVRLKMQQDQRTSHDE